MKVLVTGGTGVIGRATITELLRRGHAVRLLARRAAEDAREWPAGVEPFTGDVTTASSIAGAADRCDAVIHIVGIVSEMPPALTYENVNINGTANVIAAAQQAGVSRFIFVSSLGVERGESAYHTSKLTAERLVQSLALPWTIVRVGAVMGPGDDTVSVLLRMLRTLPAVPVIATGDQPFQPVWHEDVAWALAECLDRTDVARRIVNIAGPDTITVRELLDLFGTVTDRNPLRVPVPSFVARVGSSIASAVGIATPVSAATVQMLLEGNYLRADESNDLLDLFGYQPLPTRNRLIQLADELPEQTPEDGVGPLQRRRFSIDIADSTLSARVLHARFRTRFAGLVPFEAAAEPGAPTRIEEGATLTLQLPARGHVQVRVEHVDDRTITLATIEGHPLAGIVRFHFEDRPDGVIRFTIDVVERAASRVDQIAMALGGSAVQKRTWQTTAETVAAEAGGVAPAGVVGESWTLDDDAAAPVEAWVRDIVLARKRRENGT